MGIVTAPMRKAIKVFLINKYIDQCGIKMPKVPHIPNFTPPPMPSMDMLNEQIDKLKESAKNMDGNSIYTVEYLEASKRYNELAQEAAEKRDAALAQLERDYEDNEALSVRERVLAVTSNEYTSKQDAVWETYFNDLEQIKADTEIETITKFKKISGKEKKKANEAAEKETESKKNAAKKETLEVVKKMLLAAYNDWYEKEKEKADRLVEESKAAYNDTVEMFKAVKKEAKEYFQSGGAGDAFVEEECDKIDRIFDNFKESFAELATDIGTLVAKIPNPDVIVAGAATGIPNPAQKVMVFMENMKKVLTDTKKIINYIKEIIAIATALGFAIKDLIPAFKKLCDAFEAKQADSEKAFRQAVKALRKRQKWYLKHERPKDEDNKDETKLAGYMYADAEVDYANHEIKVNGFKCYCCKDYARTYTENGQVKKSYWIGDYHKNSGPFMDSAGRRYYYIPADEISGATDLDESDFAFDAEDYDVDLGTDYDPDADTTMLSLSDGRTITIDYLAASGDIIKLDDGTVIRVK